MNDLWFIEVHPKGAAVDGEIAIFFVLSSMLAMLGRKIKIEYKIYSPELGELFNGWNWYQLDDDDFCFGTMSAGEFEYKDLTELKFCVEYRITEIASDILWYRKDMKFDVVDPFEIGRRMRS